MFFFGGRGSEFVVNIFAGIFRRMGTGSGDLGLK